MRGKSFNSLNEVQGISDLFEFFEHFTVILFIASEGEFSGATSTGETYVPRTTSAVVSLSSHLRFSSRGFRTAVIYRINDGNQVRAKNRVMVRSSQKSRCLLQASFGLNSEF